VESCGSSVRVGLSRLGSVPRDQYYSLCDYLMHCFIFVGIGNMTGGDTGTSPLSNLEGFHMPLWG